MRGMYQVSECTVEARGRACSEKRGSRADKYMRRVRVQCSRVKVTQGVQLCAGRVTREVGRCGYVLGEGWPARCASRKGGPGCRARQANVGVAWPHLRCCAMNIP